MATRYQERTCDTWDCFWVAMCLAALYEEGKLTDQEYQNLIDDLILDTQKQD